MTALACRTRWPVAFTLIEVLVVVAIVALLIAILVPSLVQAGGQARTSACMSNLHQFGVAFALYGHDHRQQPPRNATAGTPALAYRDSDWWYYPHMVAKYLPTDNKSEPRAGFLGVFACPADADTGRAYAMNAFAGDALVEYPIPKPACPAAYPHTGGCTFNPFTVKHPSRYLLVGEAHAIYLDSASGLYGTSHVIGARTEPYYNFRLVIQYLDRELIHGAIHFRHPRERANFLLSDMSVRSLLATQVVDDQHCRSRMEVWWSPEDIQLNLPL